MTTDDDRPRYRGDESAPWNGTWFRTALALCGGGLLLAVVGRFWGRHHAATIISQVAVLVWTVLAIVYQRRKIVPDILPTPSAGSAGGSDAESAGGLPARRRSPISCGMIALICFCVVVMLPTLNLILGDGHSRVRSNEISAIVCLRNYGTAQVTFSLGKQHTSPGNTSPELTDYVYADNFRNLCYGIASGRDMEVELRLISQAMADAFLMDNALGGAPTRAGGIDVKPAPYQGYLFIEDLSGDLPRSEYGTRYALMAIPAVLDKTGRYVFWIGEEGVVYRQKPKMPKGTTADDLLKLYRGVSGSTPLAKQARDWEMIVK